jgi:hypothetical protein
MFSNKWEVKCCTDAKAKKQFECEEGGDIKCSKKYSENKLDYYSMCPLQTKQKCGLPRNYDNLNLYAESSSKTFYSNNRYKTHAYKVPEYNVCTYKIMTPPGGYNGGKLYVTFSKIESGATVYFANSKDNKVRTLSSRSSFTREYSVDNGNYFTYTVVPQ